MILIITDSLKTLTFHPVSLTSNNIFLRLTGTCFEHYRSVFLTGMEHSSFSLYRLGEKKLKKHTMKKYVLFAVAALLAFTLNAAERLSQVTLRADKNYDVVIDGQTYRGNANIPLSQGYHQVQVYTRGGFIIKRRSLVSSSSFNLRNNDVMIDVDQNGQMRIFQDSYSRNGRNGNYDDRNYDDRNYKGSRGDNGRGWGPYDNPGRGHKYGLYKNKDKKNKKNHDKDWDDRDDD
jgi:hypothetical protein